MSQSERGKAGHLLELKIPPPVVFGICAVLVFAIDRLAPPAMHVSSGFWFEAQQGTWNWALRSSLVAVAAALVIWAIANFKRANTTTDPGDPARATSLVESGPFRWLRNPMYFALTLLLIALSLKSTSPLAWLAWPLLPLYLTRFQILPEERLLGERFGPAYRDYTHRTGRWFPRRR